MRGLIVSLFQPLRRAFDRASLRAVHRARARVDRFKLARRTFVRDRLIADPVVAAAVREHAAEQGTNEAAAWARVERYIREIVPFFNILAYYAIGYRVSGWLLRLFYKVSVDHEEPGAGLSAPVAPANRGRRDAITIYLMNHRSNADYVLVSYVLAGRVAISYAVGEWARAFPLEQVFKAFGSYFVRRRYRERLYHTVLERYVQLITREGVTQGIFLEGGLTRDGRLRPPKIGLLDYVLGIARDPAYRDRLFVVPVAVNYDRVLEDRSLLRELDASEGGRPPGRLTQLREVVHYLIWNVGRLVVRRWKRYGRAAVMIGRPMPLRSWLDANPDLFEMPRHERLAAVQRLCDTVMERIGTLVPVTPVPLVCATLQSLGGDFVSRARVLQRIAELRMVLNEVNARDVRSELSDEVVLDRALRMLRMRRVLIPDGDGYAILPKHRPLVSYYANSIAHLLGPYSDAVRERDALPMDRLPVDAHA
jgi:glycerol-3-phosphate O-acyltransferase